MWELVHGRERLLILGTSQHRGTQRKMLRRGPKNNNKAWIKLSEAILRIVGDLWEKFECFPRPTPSKTEGRVPRQQSAPTTCNLDLLGSFPADASPDITGHFGCGPRAKLKEKEVAEK